MLHSQRNLVGDVRDIRTDRFELPARSTMPGSWACRVHILAAIPLCIFLGLRVIPLAADGVLLVSWLTIELLAWRYGNRRAYLWGYVGHRVLILTTTLFHLLIAIPRGLTPGWAVFLAALTLILHPTYRYLPGKRFPEFGPVHPTPRLSDPARDGLLDESRTPRFAEHPERL